MSPHQNTMKNLPPHTIVLTPLEDKKYNEESSSNHADHAAASDLIPRPVLSLAIYKNSELDTTATSNLKPSSKSLILGRNSKTQITDETIPECVCTIHSRVDNNCNSNSSSDIDFRLIVASSQSVFLNDRKIQEKEEEGINSGDILSLQEMKYRYQINVIRPYNNNNETMTAKKLPQMSLGKEPHSTATSSSYSSSSSSNTNDITTTTTSSTATASTLQISEEQKQKQQKQTKEKEEQNKIAQQQYEQQLQKAKQMTQSQLQDEVTCSICMEILVKTQVANPCGHLFCAACIAKLPKSQQHVPPQPPPPPGLPPALLQHYMSRRNAAAHNNNNHHVSCPSCRVHITGFTWARSVDNTIWNMILMGNVFGGKDGEDDLKHFLERKKGGGSGSSRSFDSLSDVELDCILNRNSGGGQSQRKNRDNNRVSSSLRQREEEDKNKEDCQVMKRPRRVRLRHPRSNHPSSNRHHAVVDLTELSSPREHHHSGSNDDPICL